MKAGSGRKNAGEPSSDVELVLDREVPAAKKKGTASIRGVIKHPWGTVKDATVSLGETSVHTDKDGSYEFTELIAGSYVLDVKLPFPGYKAQPQNVEIADGEGKVLDVYVDFEKIPVEGHVYDPDGKPIAGALISGLRCGKEMATTTTDEKGYFKFDRASPGNQFIRVNAAGYTAETRDFRTSDDKATALEFHMNRASCRIHGTVRDTENRPLQAVVVLRASTGVILERATSNAETGHYEFAVLPGDYGLLAEHSEYEYEGWRGSVSGETEVNFKLKAVPPQKPERSSERHHD